jgi:hypothetical protein
MLGDMGRLYWVLLALAACGDDSNRKIADAPPGGQKDAPGQMDAPPANSPVTVLVKDDAGPTQGAKVYFQASDSTVIASSSTDTGGTASAVMPMGGLVTVVQCQTSKGTMCHLNTWGGVKPGDHLILDQSGGGEGSSVNVTVVLPPDPNHTLSQYQVSTTCGVGYISVGTGSAVVATTTGPITVFCATADVLVVGLDIDGQAVSSFFVPAQTFTEGGTLDYSAKTFTDAATRTYQFTNNTDMVDIPLADSLTTTGGTLFQPSGVTLQGNPAVASAQFPAIPTGTLDVIAVDQYVSATEERLFFEWGTTGNYTQDWAAHLLPDFTPDSVTFDTATHALGWASSGGALVPDFVGTSTYANNGLFWTWDMFGPGTTSLAFPTLPTDLGDFNYDHSPELNAIYTAKVPGGYDAVRATIFASPPHPTGASGTISFNRYIPISLFTATRQAPGKRDVMRRWIRHR